MRAGGIPLSHRPSTSFAEEMPSRATTIAALLLLPLATVTSACDDEGDGPAPGQTNQLTSGGAAGSSDGSAGGTADGAAGTGSASIAALGEPCESTSGAVCGDGLFCDHAGTAGCGEIGTCRAKPEGCVSTCDPGGPVCGCDGQRYCSTCDAWFKGVSLSPGGVGCDQ